LYSSSDFVNTSTPQTIPSTFGEGGICHIYRITIVAVTFKKRRVQYLSVCSSSMRARGFLFIFYRIADNFGPRDAYASSVKLLLAFFDSVLTRISAAVHPRVGKSENDERKGENKYGADEQHGRSQ
jgi:hypothetical protein